MKDWWVNKNMLNIVLYNPEIPQNTGAIGRLCVNIGARLHIIKPISFDISQKAVRRAGLDYWHKLDLKVWENIDEFMQENSEKIPRFFYATTKSSSTLYDKSFKKDDFIFFGAETKGLPMEFMQQNFNNAFCIPMGKEGRSLNLAMSVAIASYELIRQNLENFDFKE